MRPLRNSLVIAVAAIWILGAPRLVGAAPTAASPSRAVAARVVPSDARPARIAAVTAVTAVAIPVSDMRRALEFYTRVLPFEVVADREVAGDRYEQLYGVFGVRVRAVRLRLGDEAVELVQFLAPRGRALPEDSRANDGWFQHVALIVSDLDAAYAHLRRHDVEHASSGPQVLPSWNPNAGGIGAFYFRDSEGNFLEVLHFPAGKGDPRWQDARGRLFLGIDHTAIVVADTERALRWYRDALGLRVAGNSENYGTEQEHLNNVFGARLRITALRAASGPGIELLEYLTPRTGRPTPADTRANDRWAWQIWLATRSPLDVAWRVAAAEGAVASSADVALDDALGLARAVLLRDPDGHAALLAASPGP
jgi:catechol 2,3-dioxygenase-like lactoylglutathione lyase family enzyme